MYLNFDLLNSEYQMKPFISTIFILFSLLTCTAQNPTIQTLQKFTELKVYDRITVSLIQGNENKLEVNGEHKEDISIVESNGQLKIKMTIKEFLSGNTVNVKLYYTEALAVIDANENARIIANNSIKTGSLEIRAQEAGIVTLNIEAQSVLVKSTTGSEIKLSGTVDTQNAAINTGGKLYNKGLKSVSTTVTVLGGGHAEIFATETAVGKVKAGGTIIINGNPKNIDTDDTFGGTIKVIE